MLRVVAGWGQVPDVPVRGGVGLRALQPDQLRPPQGPAPGLRLPDATSPRRKRGDGGVGGAAGARAK